MRYALKQMNLSLMLLIINYLRNGDSFNRIYYLNRQLLYYHLNKIKDLINHLLDYIKIVKDLVVDHNMNRIHHYLGL
jgi:hypothetical protein